MEQAGIDARVEIEQKMLKTPLQAGSGGNAQGGLAYC
jgi:hypothetical protein